MDSSLQYENLFATLIRFFPFTHCLYKHSLKKKKNIQWKILWETQNISPMASHKQLSKSEDTTSNGYKFVASINVRLLDLNAVPFNLDALGERTFINIHTSFCLFPCVYLQ